MKDKENIIILNYLAYSGVGRISLRFSKDIKGLLAIFEKHSNKQEIIKEVNLLNKNLVPLVLVLLNNLKKIDYSKLNYLFKENEYLEIYFKKIILDKKLNKKDQIINNHISDLFKTPKIHNINQLKLKRLVNFVNTSNILEKPKTKLNFIFLKTIKGVSSGYGNYNFVIIESNVFPEEIIIHEIIHNCYKNNNFFRKKSIAFEEIFTNVVSQAIYCDYKKKPIAFNKYYYSSKKEQKLEDKIRKQYLKWNKKPSSSFLEYLKKM